MCKIKISSPLALFGVRQRCTCSGSGRTSFYKLGAVMVSWRQSLALAQGLSLGWADKFKAHAMNIFNFELLILFQVFS